jgi:tetratricopeptide (TPR) repeat protein
MDLNDMLISAWCLEAQLNFDESKPHLKDLVSKLPKSAFEKTAIGKVWELLGEKDKAIIFYKKSAKNGIKFAQHYLACNLGNKLEVIEWYKKSADQGFFKSEISLCTKYEFPKDIKLRIKILSKYPDYPSALCNLGLIYWELDYRNEARDLFNKACDMGFEQGFVFYNKYRIQNTGPLLRLLNDPIRKYDANQIKIPKFFFKTEQ